MIHHTLISFTDKAFIFVYFYFDLFILQTKPKHNTNYVSHRSIYKVHLKII